MSSRRFEERAEPANWETPSFSVKPSDTFPGERAPHSAWGNQAGRRGGAPGIGGGPGGAGRGRRPQQGQGGERRCGGCSGTFCRWTPARRSREAQGPAGPRRRPDGPACPCVEGGRASPARAPGPPRSLRGACGLLSGPRTGALSLTPPAAAQIRTRRRPRAKRHWPNGAPRGLGRRQRPRSLSCGRAGGASVSGWGGARTGGWGVAGRGGPLASADLGNCWASRKKSGPGVPHADSSGVHFQTAVCTETALGFDRL